MKIFANPPPPNRLRFPPGKPLYMDFTPQPDLTAYELAQIFMIHEYPKFEEDWIALGTLQRHFTRREG